MTDVDTKFVTTPSGRIAYVEHGSGRVALFVHGVLVNKHVWRKQTTDLSDIRRTIALDLLAHGETEVADGHDLSVTANAHMIREFLDVLDIDKVDIVGNDSGGGISQIFCALYPERVRSLTVTNSDAQDNWPPVAFMPFVEMVKAGGLRDTINAMLRDKSIYRSEQALGPAYEHPQKVTDHDIETYLTPHVASNKRIADLEQFVAAFDNKHTLSVEAGLRALHAPTLIVWGTDDIYFPVKWAHWLAEIIPGAKPPVELTGARLFFPEERAERFNELLREHLVG